MKATSWSVLVLASAAAVTNAAHADQSQAKGFIEGSSATVTFRNGYMERDYKHASRHNIKDQSRWGQGFIGKYSSGYTQGTVGFGLDAIGLYSLRLDQGKNKNDGGISFFGVNSKGDPYRDIGKAGATVKARVSNTVLKYGDLIPNLPVVTSDTSALIPQTFTGTLLTSQEISGLVFDIGRFTAMSDNNKAGRDSHHLKRLDIVGATYTINPQWTAALYHADNQDKDRRSYGALSYLKPLDHQQSWGVNFQMYRTRYSDKFVTNSDEGLTGGNNTIWSLGSTYTLGPHTFMAAYQHSSGNRGFQYNIGDGGSSFWLPNSYLSNFDGKDERSWQVSYQLDFSEFGMPGLTWHTAFVRGTNVDANFYDATSSGRGTEREIYNQVEYTVQNGAAKDLSVTVRSSILRTSNTYKYNPSTNEIRLFITYPLKLL